MPPSSAELRLRRLQSEAYLNLSRIHRELERKVADMFKAAGLRDVTPAQAGVLIHLFQERAPLTARQLAGMMALSEVTVGRFVRALEVSNGLLDRAFAGFSAQEIEAIARTTEMVRDNLCVG